LTSTSFRELGVPAGLASTLDRLGLTEPFPIQTLTLPDALAGRDVSGRAPTGSGKTLAFALPIAHRVARGKPGRPRALVLVPTRELASQVRDTLVPFASANQRSVATFYGGTNIRKDQQQLRRGVDVVVATPGRLADLVQRRDIDLRDVDIVVLDEADRMADMGFLPEVKRLLDTTSPQRQTLLFSATLDGDVDVLVKRYQRNPVRHEFEALEETKGDVRHVFFAAERPQRRQLTADIIRDRGPAIVFTRTKHGADRLAKQLTQDGIATAAIHGNRSQSQREHALQRFSDGKVTALIATDVAARGIHVDDVALVLHHDLPATDKDYVHRSGRTGRAGATGLVVSFVGADQLKDLDDIQKLMELPRGLHDLDLQVLDADDLPHPTARRDSVTVDGGRTRAGGNGGQGSGQQRRSSGSRHAARTAAPRERGQSSGRRRARQR
jgi:superfamily II DNA/RNA helicase